MPLRLESLDQLLDRTAPAGGASGSKPIVVEIEVNSRCNRRCGYCPVSLNPTPNVPRFMERTVFDKAIADLQTWCFDGRLSYHFYGEPLLRRDLEQCIAHAAAALPDALHVVYTNGDLLTERRYESLIAAGVSHIVVTRHDGDGPAFAKRPFQTVLVPSQLTLTNRGGTLARRSKPVSKPCYAPSEILVITVTGDVVLCYEDAGRANTFGNLCERSLREIWSSPAFSRAREVLARGDRGSAAAICARCDNTAHVLPGRSMYSE